MIGDDTYYGRISARRGTVVLILRHAMVIMVWVWIWIWLLNKYVLLDIGYSFLW